MGYYTIPKRPLKPFRHFLPKSFRGSGKRRALDKTLKEEAVEETVTGASAIVIYGASTDSERDKAIKEFADDIRNMNGETVVAIAVVAD